MSMHKAEKPVCTVCGGDDIRCDAYAEWSIEKQDWVLVTTFDNTDCEKCGGECSIDWIEVSADQMMIDRCKAAGWQWDEGGPHWYRNAPGASALEPYQYAKTVEEALGYD